MTLPELEGFIVERLGDKNSGQNRFMTGCMSNSFRILMK